MNVRAWGGAALMVFVAQAFAADVAVTDASVRATAPGQDSAAVSMHIRAQKDAKLVAVSTSAAERVEIHIMKHENGMMEMRAVDTLALPANQDVALGSGSHLMLVGLKRPLKAGERVSLSLTVEFTDKHKEVIKVVAPVKPMVHGEDTGTSGMDGQGMKGHDMDGHSR